MHMCIKEGELSDGVYYSSSNKDTNPIGFRDYIYDLIYLNCLSKHGVSRYQHRRVRAQLTNSEETQFNPQCCIMSSLLIPDVFIKHLKIELALSFLLIENFWKIEYSKDILKCVIFFKCIKIILSNYFYA